MDHQIQETELVPRKQAKMRFRERILQGWDYCCAYCGDPLGKNATLDHVHPKCKGGETILSNMVGCCFSCNSHKSGHDWIQWFRDRDYWSPDREDRILKWLAR